MKIPTYEFKEKEIEIINLGDIHFGNEHYDDLSLQKVIDYIKHKENCYWISTGDLLEIAIKSSKVADVYNSMSPEKEYDMLIKRLEPIKEKGICLVSSNHHDRIEKETSISIDRMICSDLGIDFYGDTAVIRTLIAGTGFYHLLHHGFGGGRQNGSKLNNLIRVGEIVKECDIIWAGHTHTYNTTVMTRDVVDRKHCKVVERESLYICTGHFLNYGDINIKGSYARKMGLIKAPVGSAKVTLYGGKNIKNFKGELLTPYAADLFLSTVDGYKIKRKRNKK